MANSVRKLWRGYRSVPIVYRIGLAFVLGSILGIWVGKDATKLQPLGDLFIRLLKMIIVPIVVFTIIMAASELSPENLGKIGTEVVVLYLLTTVIAIAIGLVVSNVLNPGVGLKLTGESFVPPPAPPLTEVLLGAVPENPIRAMAEDNILGVITFSLVFGLGMAIVRDTTEPGTAVHDGVEMLFTIIKAGAEVMFKVVWGVMEYGVIGVFALMAALFGRTGPEAIVSLFKLALSLTVAIGLQITVVYLLLILMVMVGRSPFAFLRGIKEALITALSIRSSTGTLPVSMSNAEEHLRIDKQIYSFSLPLGATINMDGTAMYLGIAAIFTANVVDVHLTLMQQFTVLLTALLASIGTAGVPGASIIMMTVVFSQVGLPLAPLAMIAGIDPLLDRLRTMNNITGDLAVTTLVAKWNNAIDLSGGVWSN